MSEIGFKDYAVEYNVNLYANLGDLLGGRALQQAWGYAQAGTDVNAMQGTFESNWAVLGVNELKNKVIDGSYMDDPSGVVLTKINGWFAANVPGGYTKTVVVGEVDRVIAGNVLAYFITSPSTASIQRVAEDIVAFQIGARVGSEPLDMLSVS